VYDALHRVTGSSGLAAGTTAYQYDLDSNRTRKVEGAVTTNYGSVLSFSVRSVSFSRDGTMVAAMRPVEGQAGAVSIVLFPMSLFSP
jgi:YD repeat-containing protein